MILHIAKKEFTEALRDNKFRISAGLLTILVIFAMLVSWNYYQKVNQEYQQASKTARNQWETQTPKNPHSAAHFGTFAFKPVQTLSLIDNGLDKYLGVSVFLEAHKQNNAAYKQIADQNDLARFAELTPTFVFVYLLPLLIILLAFNTITSEKENDTLRLLLSQGIHFRQLAMGKMAGIWLILLTLLLPIFSLGLVLIFVSENQSSDIGNYILLIFSLLLYYAVFINIAVAVSAWAKSSNIALVCLLGFWITSALLLPKISSNLSKTMYPTPSAIVYQKQLKEDLEKGVDGHNPFSEKSKQFEDSVLKANKVDSVHKLPFNYAGLSMQAGEEHETVVYARALKNLNNIYFSQLNFYQSTALLSPTILLKMLSMQFAKTDLQTHYEFTQQAENYRIALVRDLNYDLKDNSKYGDWDYISQDKDFFKKNVKFDYKPISFSQTLANTSLALTLLVLWVLASIFLLQRATKKVNL